MTERNKELEAIATTETPAEPKDTKKEQMFSIRTSKEKHTKYKTYFASKGLSLSKGFLIAVDYLIDQEAKGKLELKDTGIYTK